MVKMTPGDIYFDFSVRWHYYEKNLRCIDMSVINVIILLLKGSNTTDAFMLTPSGSGIPQTNMILHYSHYVCTTTQLP